jgi:hypothetical protein
MCLPLSWDASPGCYSGGALGDAPGGGEIAGNSAAVVACRRRSPPEPLNAGAFAARRRARVGIEVASRRCPRDSVGVGVGGGGSGGRDGATFSGGGCGGGGGEPSHSASRGRCGGWRGLGGGVTVSVCARHTSAKVLLGRRYLGGRASGLISLATSLGAI